MTSEFRTHCAVVRWLRDNCSEDVIFFHPNQGAANAWRGAKEKSLGVRKGIPDLCLIWPVGTTAKHAYVEIKTDAGRLTKEQQDFFAEVGEMGCYTAIVRSVEDMIRYADEWKLPRQEKEEVDWEAVGL